jgi:nucleoside-diphosphate-sugar epimerase
MRCLVTGAYGFIGREVVAALKHEGISVVGAGRDLEFRARVLPDIEWIACDFNEDSRSRSGCRVSPASMRW